jgi:hypothetical protein
MKPVDVLIWVAILFVMAERFIRLSLPKLTAFN